MSLMHMSIVHPRSDYVLYFYPYLTNYKYRTDVTSIMNIRDPMFAIEVGLQ
jgi:hypothetical protein